MNHPVKRFVSSAANSLRIAVAWILAGLFVAQLALSVFQFQNLLAPVVESPGRSYDAKMQLKWDGYYEFVHFVKENTPDDATILIGPGWNGPMDLYFLYPRHLIYGGAQLLQAHPEIDYVVANGAFPELPMPGERLMLDDSHGLIRVLRP